MILVDTSVWIEFLKKTDPDIDLRLSMYIENGQVGALSLVFGELLQGVRDEREEKLILELWKHLPKIDESQLFIEAGKLSYRHKLFSKGVGLIDACILAAALRDGHEIWTLDKKLLLAFSTIGRS